MNEAVIQICVLMACVVCFVVLVAAGLCAFTLHSAFNREDATRDTLDQLFRLTNDRCMNISDAHLEAKRDEWAGKHVHSQVARPRVIESQADVEEGAEQKWGDVSAVGTPNGRS